MAFDKHTPAGKEHFKHNRDREGTHEKNDEKKKKPFEEGTNSEKGRNLDAYDKEQKHDKELGEKKP